MPKAGFREDVWEGFQLLWSSFQFELDKNSLYRMPEAGECNQAVVRSADKCVECHSIDLSRGADAVTKSSARSE